MMKLYAMSVSGNCWKVAYMLRSCHVPYRIVPTSYDGANNTVQTRSTEFLSKNPNGQTPLLEFVDRETATTKYLAESNAILLYLSETNNHKLMPVDPYERGQVYSWLFFEQYSHEPYIAVRRANIIFQRKTSLEIMDNLLQRGNRALSIMEQALVKTNAFLVGPECTVADIALFAYTNMAEEGGFRLSTDYPAVTAWLQRMKSLPEFAGMEILQA